MHILSSPSNKTLCVLALVIASCFAPLMAFGEDDCYDYYFGLSGPPQFSKAFKCFSDQKERTFLILMYLNGEGTRVNVRKAEELFKKWQETAPYQARTLEGEALHSAIQERKTDTKGPHPRLDYCRDIAQTTLAMNDCNGFEERIAERKLKEYTTRLKVSMSAADAAIFEKIVIEFQAFKHAEGLRMYTQYSEGSIRDMAGLAQESFVRDQFLALLKKTLEQHVLNPADTKILRAADYELNRVYRKNVQDYVSENSAKLRDKELSGWHHLYRENISEYRKHAKEAQIHWIKYRDLWAELVKSQYRSLNRKDDPAIDIKTALTKVRIKELRNDPVGPE